MQIVSIILIFVFESNGSESSTLKTTDQEKNSEDGENANQGDLQSRQEGSEKNRLTFFITRLCLVDFRDRDGIPLTTSMDFQNLFNQWLRSCSLLRVELFAFCSEWA